MSRPTAGTAFRGARTRPTSEDTTGYHGLQKLLGGTQQQSSIPSFAGAIRVPSTAGTMAAGDHRSCGGGHFDQRRPLSSTVADRGYPPTATLADRGPRRPPPLVVPSKPATTNRKPIKFLDVDFLKNGASPTVHVEVEQLFEQRGKFWVPRAEAEQRKKLFGEHLRLLRTLGGGKTVPKILLTCRSFRMKPPW